MSNPPDFNNAPTVKKPEGVDAAPAATAPPADAAPAKRPNIFKRFKDWAHRHTALLWMMHSVYALFLGVMVMLFAAKGFEHARILAATLGGAFLLSVVIFRVFGQGKEQVEKVASRKYGKIQFTAMNYFLKNMYQGMLFFLLPFYWKSSTLDSINAWFTILLAVLAFLSTMDLVFDHVLMRYKVLAAIFYSVTLFACANLVLPAFFPNIPTIVALLSSTVLAVFGFWLLHFPLRTFLDKRTWMTIGLVAGAALAAVYFARITIPPVPLHVRHGGVGIERMEDGKLAYEITQVHKSKITSLFAVTDVAMPGGKGDTFRHRWRNRDGDFDQEGTKIEVKETGEDKDVVRVGSEIPADALKDKLLVGNWTVDVLTDDGQIVGRSRFKVVE